MFRATWRIEKSVRIKRALSLYVPYVPFATAFESAGPRFEVASKGRAIALDVAEAANNLSKSRSS